MWRVVTDWGNRRGNIKSGLYVGELLCTSASSVITPSRRIPKSACPMEIQFRHGSSFSSTMFNIIACNILCRETSAVLSVDTKIRDSGETWSVLFPSRNRWKRGVVLAWGIPEHMAQTIPVAWDGTQPTSNPISSALALTFPHGSPIFTRLQREEGMLQLRRSH